MSNLLLNINLCITCNRQIQEAIYNSQFYPNLLTMLSAFFVLAALVIALSYQSNKRHRLQVARNPDVVILNPVPLTTAATVLGIGIGGFIDGIVLHQILQWHNMLSAKLPPDDTIMKSVNMFWDGIFHLFTLIVVIIGIALLWKLIFRNDIDKGGRLMWGGMLIGWGLFNLIEGIIDHQLLKLHNVREVTPTPEAWNIGFLVLSVFMLLIGWMLIRRMPI